MKQLDVLLQDVGRMARFVALAALTFAALPLQLACNAPQPTRKEEIRSAWDEQRGTMKVELASAELRSGRTDAALKLANEAVALDPQRLEARELQAQVHIALGDLRTAEQQLVALVTETPDAAKAWFLLGTLHERQREWDLASDDYERAAAIEPDKLDYLAAWAQCQASAGDAAKGVQTLEREQQRFFSEPAFHAAIAGLYQSTGDLPRAIKSYRVALKMGADERTMNEKLGLLLSWSGKPDEALEHLGSLLADAEGPVDESLATAYVGALIAKNQPREALQWLRRPALKRADSAAMLVLEAQALAATEDFKAALDLTGRAQKLAPQMADGWLLAAGLHARLDQKDEALECAEQTLRLAPDNLDAWRIYVQILERFGEKESARIARERMGSLSS